MKFQKRVFVGIVAGLIGVSALAFSASAYGSDNDIPYSFNVPANQGWGYSKPEERGNSGSEVPWKVEFTYSSEGRSTYMYYFLREDFWANQLSDYKRVLQGSEIKYFQAYGIAANKKVGLGAMNNNDVDKNYTVAGYWDEETAYHSFSKED